MATPIPPAIRQPLDRTAVSVMVVLCTIWASQTIMIKLASPDMGNVAQVGIRSVGATLLLWCYALWSGDRLWQKDGSLRPGLLAGFLFAMEFVCVTFGLMLTSATHVAVFLYTAPLFSALGLHFLVPGEQLSRRQWVGMGLAFAGLALAMSDGFLAQQGIDWRMFAGDLIGLAGGAFWGVTTVAIRASALSEVSPVKTLMYELGFTGALLTPMAWLLGEFDSFHFTLTSSLSLAYQTTILCSASYLGWLILLRRYLATRLAVFSFLTPIIAAVFGWLILGDAISHSFIGGGVLVMLGIMVVNRR